MNWGDIGKQLIGLGLPTIGTLLGGPLGGAAGKVVADALGVPATPQAVGEAISSDPEVQKKLADTEAEWARTNARIAEAAATQSVGINQSIQAETAAGVSWWHWRHLNGYTVQLYAVAMLTGFCTAMWLGRPNVSEFVSLMGVITGVFLALCALNGYVASDTTKRTTAAAAGVPVGGLIEVIGGLFKKK